MVEEKESNTPRAVQLCHEALVWIIPQLDKFSRLRRFTLGERIEQGLLDVLGDLVEASYSRKNKTTLQRANRKLALVRHIWRVSFELQHIDRRRYLHGVGLTVDIGRQIGGWLKFEASV